MHDPADYWPKMSSRLGADQLRRQEYWHALPKGWEQMEYGEFLEARRGLIADVIRQGFKRLCDEEATPEEAEGEEGEDSVEPAFHISDLIASGESQSLEFKSSGRWNLHTRAKDPKMEHVLVKTVCGFLNAEGGNLLIGVGDDGRIIGLDNDYLTFPRKPNKDRFELWLRQHLDKSLSCQTAGIVRIEFEEVGGNEICVVHVGASTRPVFAKPLSGGSTASEFWVRVGNATKQMHGPDMVDYQAMRWGAGESWRPLGVEANVETRQSDPRGQSDHIADPKAGPKEEAPERPDDGADPKKEAPEPDAQRETPEAAPQEETFEPAAEEENREPDTQEHDPEYDWDEWRMLRKLRYLKHFYEAPGGRLHRSESKRLAIQEGYDIRGTAGFYYGRDKGFARLKGDGEYRVLTDAGRRMYTDVSGPSPHA